MITDPERRSTTTVHDIMTSPVLTVNLDSTVAEVAELLGRHRISAVPVLDPSGSLSGLVSEYDILAKHGSTAAEVMTTEVITVSEETEVEVVRHLLVERHIGRLPVVARGHLVGIVSRSDVVATMTTEWVCEVCGESTRGPNPPPICPRCHGSEERFVLQEQPPGS